MEPQPAIETIALKDDEGTEVSGEEIKDSMEKAFVRYSSYQLNYTFHLSQDADSPKDAQEHEEVVAEGEEVSADSSKAAPQQENTESTTSEADATSEEKPELEVTQPEPPATNETSEVTQEIAVGTLIGSILEMNS